MKSIKIARGTITLTPRGHYLAYMYERGKRHRKVFREYSAAEQWLKAVSENALPPPLTNIEYQDAQYAIRELPENTRLIDAVRYFARHYKARKADVILIDTINQFLEAKKISTAKATIDKYRNLLQMLVRITDENATLSSVKTSNIESLVKDVSPVYRNNILRHLSAFFSWCISQEMLVDNPCIKIERAKNVKAPLGILSPSEAEAVLRYAEAHIPSVVPYLAVGMFAGVRPQEMQRMNANNIRNGYIVLDATITKTADARTIVIRENLARWLEEYPWISATDYQLRELKKATKSIANWSHDCLRHSFATYAYELTKDANLVASEMGHHGTKVFFTHYRALATPESGARFFSITPKRKDSIHTPIQIESQQQISN